MTDSVKLLKRVSTISAARALIHDYKQAGETVALVPTMGNLHAGHLSLVEHARQIADRTVVSIFVNPLQFAPHEDFENYPRTLEHDLDLLESQETDLVFIPEGNEIFPQTSEQTLVTLPSLCQVLCGAFRPQFFNGVATVVVKLLNIIQPDYAIFGEKDYQQLVIIKQLVSDLNMPIQVVGGSTVRDQTGLALSSRNQYLSVSERKVAPHLHSTLLACKREIESGQTDVRQLCHLAKQTLQTHGFKPDYVSVRERHHLRDCLQEDKELIILAAAWLGKARLLDNVFVERS